MNSIQNNNRNLQKVMMMKITNMNKFGKRSNNKIKKYLKNKKYIHNLSLQIKFKNNKELIYKLYKNNKQNKIKVSSNKKKL